MLAAPRMVLTVCMPGFWLSEGREVDCVQRVASVWWPTPFATPEDVILHEYNVTLWEMRWEIGLR